MLELMRVVLMAHYSLSKPLGMHASNFLPVPSQDKLESKGIWHKNGGMMEVGR